MVELSIHKNISNDGERELVKLALEDSSGVAIDAVLDSTSLGDGSVSAPALTFTSEPTTGIFLGASDTISIAANGTEPFNVSDLLIGAGVPINATDGSISTPSYSFTTSADSGLYITPDASLGISESATQLIEIGTTIPKTTVNFAPEDASLGDYYESTSLATIGNSSLATNESDLTNSGTVAYTSTLTDSNNIKINNMATFSETTNERLSSNSLGSDLTGKINGTALTISFWIYDVSFAGSGRGILSFQSSGLADGIYVYRESTSNVMLFRLASSSTEYIKIDEDAIPATGVWTHYAITLSTTAGNVVYKNGVASGMSYLSGNTATNYINSTPTDMGVGGGISLFATSHDGHIANLMVSGKVYTAAEMLDLYNYQKNISFVYSTYSGVELSGVISMPTQSLLEVSHQTTQTITTATDSTCLFTTETNEINVGDYTNGACVISEDGIYLISYSINYAANATGYREAWVELPSGLKGGRSICHTNSGSVATTLNGTWTGSLGVADQISVGTYQTSGGDLATGGVGDLSNFLTISKIA